METKTLASLHTYWRAANYLAAGQIYLQANPLLREPLRPEHIKPRLLGHWGTSPGLNLIYAHLNRLIRDTRTPTLLITGPGHGAPAILANLYLEGTYTDYYPRVTQDQAGMQELFRQFSTPGGVPSHVGPSTPGSLHEGGELGYSLAHAFGVAFDHPGLLVACVIGDGEAETGPLAASWRGVDFLHPRRDGAVLPILHLNGYKISGPTLMGRKTREELVGFLSSQGYHPLWVEGEDPQEVHAELAQALDEAYERIQGVRKGQGRWPALLLRTPKGWTGPKSWKGKPIEGTFRAHQVPLTEVRSDPEALALLETWLRSYRPEELFDELGQPRPEVLEILPPKSLRMGSTPQANGGRLWVPLELPDYAEFALPLEGPGREQAEATRVLGTYLREVLRKNPDRFRIFSPDETTSNRLDAVFEVTDRCSQLPILPTDEHVSPEGRIMEVLSEHLCEGWLEGYLLSGRHGLFPCYEAFATIVDSMLNQHAKWLKLSREIPWRRPIASLNYLLTSHTWRQDHNGYSHQGPGFLDTVINKKSSVTRIYLPPDANTLLSVIDHCLRSQNYVNLVVIGKQPQLQWLDLEAARAHCARGASVWAWAGSEEQDDPDVVLAAAGDVPTLETVAASWYLKRLLPELRFRVVNVVDLLTLSPPLYHPHGLDQEAFIELFTEDRPVIFAFHGYVRMIHDLVHGRPHPERFHVRGYAEEGTTTTPFDMVVRNGLSRFQLALLALSHVPRLHSRSSAASAELEGKLLEHQTYIREHLEDLPEVQNWVWESTS